MNKQTDQAETKQVVYKCEGNNIFMIAKQENHFIIVMGEYMASEKKFKTKEEAEMYVNSKPYELILNMFLIHRIYENKNKEQTKEGLEESKKTNV